MFRHGRDDPKAMSPKHQTGRYISVQEANMSEINPQNNNLQNNNQNNRRRTNNSRREKMYTGERFKANPFPFAYTRVVNPETGNVIYKRLVSPHVPDRTLKTAQRADRTDGRRPAEQLQPGKRNGRSTDQLKDLSIIVTA